MTGNFEDSHKITVDPLDPLGFIKREYLDLEIVGEDSNKQQVFLGCCSTFTENPLAIVVKARTGSGKSWLVNRVLDIFRQLGVVIEFSRITPSYLENMASKNRPPRPARTKEESDQEYLERIQKWKSQPRTIDLKGKILFIDELRGIQNAQAPKLLISEGRLKLGTVNINRESVELEVTGTPAIITTTTLAALEDAEFENRVLTVEVDESEEQTKRIIHRHALRFADPAEDLGKYQRDKAIVEFFNSLRPLKVANPFSTLIKQKYPTKNLEARRDYPKLFALSNSLTWLNQNRRRKAKKGLELFVVTDLADIVKVREIALPSLRASLIGYSEKEDPILQVFKNESETKETPSKSGLNEAAGVETSYNYLNVPQAYKKFQREGRIRRREGWFRAHVKKLVLEEYLEEHPDNEEGKKGLKYRYSEQPPETLEIDTDNYSNAIIPTWANHFHYQLLEPNEPEPSIAVKDRTTPVNVQTSPYGPSEAERGSYPENEPQPIRIQSNEESKPLNSVVPRFTEKQSTGSPTYKKVCYQCYNKGYLRLKGIQKLSDTPTGTCEDCGKPASSVLCHILRID